MTESLFIPDIYAPVALFVYRRPEHVRNTINALKNNIGAVNTDLIIFSDGPPVKPEIEIENDVARVRAELEGISGFKSVRIVLRHNNIGLAGNIISGVSEILAESDKIIVLEDDLDTSPYFLTFMNEALVKFKDNTNIGHIHGYMYPIPNMPDAIITRWVGSWGWATWQRAWKLFEPDGKKSLEKIETMQAGKKFDLGARFTRMLKRQVEGQNNSWAIRWYASLFLNNMYAVNAGRSLVRNTGNDDSGTHSKVDTCYDVEPAFSPLSLDCLLCIPCMPTENIKILSYHKSVYGLFGRIKRRLYRLIKSGRL